MPGLPSRPHDPHPPSRQGSFFASYPRQLMIHPVHLQVALSKNSQPSSQRNRLVQRSSEPLAANQESHILLCTRLRKSPNPCPPSLLPQPFTACALFVVSDSSNNTHSAHVLPRFSPIHF